MAIELSELSESQTRQQIDATAIFTALIEARAAASLVRGGMFWREINGTRYLIRTSTRGQQKSLGPESPETTALADKFLDRKRRTERRVKDLKAEMALAQKLNRAHRVGRVPNVVVAVLNALADAGLAEHFLVVGTHALYAYEAAAGVRVPADATATRDVDLFFDTRKGIELFCEKPEPEASMISVLRKADPSFVLSDANKYTAVNNQGFEVDIIRRMAKGRDPHPLRMSTDEGDIWPSQVASGDHILGARPFRQAVVATSGAMALMRTIHPMDFARIKEALSQAEDRDPLKRRKDALQALVARQITENYLPYLLTSPSPRER